MNFVISHNDEKFAACTARMEAAGIDTTAVQRINITPDTVSVPKPDWFDALPDRWALTQAILAALHAAKDAGEDCHLYEHDVVFCEDFATRYADFVGDLPDDWDAAYLGGQLLTKDLYPPQAVAEHPNVLYTATAHRNHAWIVRHRAIQRLIDWLEEPYWSCTHTCDWRIGYLQLQPDFKTYIPASGWLCGQGGGHSDLDNRDYPERWWHYTEPARTEEIARINAFYAAQAES